MKQRIIATILLLVTVLTMLASCVNYAFAEESMEGYVSLDLDELMKALHSIEIEEEDFGFGPEDKDRKEVVVEELYNTILTALNKDSDNEKTDGTIGVNDMVKYYYYCSVEIDGVKYTFNYNMKNAVNTLTTSSSSDEDKEIQKAIVAAIANGYTFDEETSYKVKTSLSNEKIVNTDTIVVSYTLKDYSDSNKTTYIDYANKTVKAGDDIFDLIFADAGNYTDVTTDDNAVVLGSYKPNKGINDEANKKHYININISHIVERDGTSVEVAHTTEEEKTQVVYNNNDDFAKETIVIPKETEVTYHVYPVSYVSAPAVDAYDVIKYVLGDDITTSSLPVFTENAEVKALVEALVAEYGYSADHYAGEGSAVEAAKAALDAERALAKAQSLRDKIDALAKVKNADGKTATDAILEHTGKTDIYEVFASKVKFADLLTLGVLGLYTFTNPTGTSDSITDGTTAVTLINAINAEHDKDVNKDYDSYTKAKATISERDGKKIDVADKKERYEDEVAKAQTKAVEAIIESILKVDGVEATIVEQYNASAYKTDFLAYDIIKNVLLTTSATANNFSFIEDLSDYVYGNSTLDDDDRETFSTVLASLTAEFAKTADSDYDSVITVKDALDALEAMEKPVGYETVATFAANLKKYKNGDTTAFDALAKVYIDNHANTVFVLKSDDKKDNQKVASDNPSTVLTLILEDEDNRQLYIDAIATGYAYTGTSTTIDTDAAAVFTKVLASYDYDKQIADANEVVADARKAAKEAAVNELIAKLLSGVLGEEKLSVVLPVRYVENTLNTKINTYNTNVKNKLAKAVYEIINNQVVVNTEGAGYPWDLVEEFEKTLKEGYKSEFYTGTSDKTTAGTYGPAVSAEDLANYEKFTAQYKEANDAMTSAKNGVDAVTSAYITVLVTIYEMEALVEGRLEEGAVVPVSYFNADNPLTTLVEAYRAASAAYDAAKAANDEAKKELTAAQTALTEAEALFESVKDEGFNFFHKEWWDARAKVKDAKDAVEEATEKVDGTKKVDGTAKKLTEATNALNKAKENLVAGFSTDDVADVDFVAAKKDFDTKKSKYTSEGTDYKTSLSDYNKKKSDLAAKQAVVDNAGENATEDEKKALEDAKTAFDKSNEAYGKAIEEYLAAAKAYADQGLVYYAESKVVEAAAKPDYDEAVAALEDTTDADGNVTKEGLKTKIAKAEEYEKGEALTNVEVYGHLDAYLEHVLGYNWEAVIRDKAVEAVNEQIKFYAVAKALKDVAANGYDKNDIKVSGYKAAIEAIEDEDNRITKLLEHSIKHNDEDIKDKKLQKETKKAYEELLEATDNVFVDNKVFKEYKKELGRSNYKYAKDQYGENNLRMYLQIENLLTYLLYTDIQENEYAMHDGEYTVRENAETGKLAYLFISYDFKAEDAE